MHYLYLLAYASIPTVFSFPLLYEGPPPTEMSKGLDIPGFNCVAIIRPAFEGSLYEKVRIECSRVCDKNGTAPYTCLSGRRIHVGSRCPTKFWLIGALKDEEYDPIEKAVRRATRVTEHAERARLERVTENAEIRRLERVTENAEIRRLERLENIRERVERKMEAEALEDAKLAAENEKNATEYGKEATVPEKCLTVANDSSNWAMYNLK
jgi:hypothetical protein